MKILVTGGSGFIGRELCKALVRRGHEILVISRKSDVSHLPFPAQVIQGDLMKALPELPQIDGVFHLAGESVAGQRWTEDYKKRILDSRIVGTRNLIQALERQNALQFFVSASAIGIYGSRGNETLTEQSGSADGFLADVCKQWEKTVMDSNLQKKGVRMALGRIGVVLGAHGGAMDQLLPLFKSGVGAPLADGRHYMSWIHLSDVVKAFIHVMDHKNLSGVFNFTAPQPVTNEVFSRDLAQALKKPLLPAVPGFVIKALYGEMASVVLASQNVIPEALLRSGFGFQYSELKSALQEISQWHPPGEEVFVAEQYLPLKKDQIFPFFAEAKNLERITPPMLNFHIEKMSTSEIQKGTFIDYKLKIRGVPVRWKTEITDWAPPKQFIDNQVSGPYKKWHHTHLFEDLGPGTLMTDIVRYRLPMGSLGKLVAGRWVRGDVQSIFDFRRATVAKEKFFPVR